MENLRANLIPKNPVFISDSYPKKQSRKWENRELLTVAERKGERS